MAWNDPKPKSEVEEQLEWPEDAIMYVLVLIMVLILFNK